MMLGWSLVGSLFSFLEEGWYIGFDIESDLTRRRRSRLHISRNSPLIADFRMRISRARDVGFFLQAHCVFRHGHSFFVALVRWYRSRWLTF